MATNNSINAPLPIVPSQGGSGLVSPTAHGVLISEGASNYNPIVLTAGQILIGTTASDPSAATLTQGNNITITSSSGSITIAASGLAGFTYNDVAGTTQAAAINNGYIISNAGQTTVTLPATAAVGSVIEVQGKGAAGWILQANTGQVIHLGNTPTSTAGSLTSTNQYDAIKVVCITANTTWATSSVIGNITVA